MTNFVEVIKRESNAKGKKVSMASRVKSQNVAQEEHERFEQKSILIERKSHGVEWNLVKVNSDQIDLKHE